MPSHSDADAIEARLLRWSESDRGRTVTFELTGDGEHPFRGERTGRTGQRYAMALAKIDDDTKADHIFPDGYTEGSKPDEGQKAVELAGVLAKDPEFQGWSYDQLPARVTVSADAEEVAAMFIRERCGILSRAELATKPEARKRFNDLVFEFRHGDQKR